MLLAIEHNRLAWFFASAELQDDRDLVLKSIECGILANKPDFTDHIKEDLLDKAVALDMRSLSYPSYYKMEVEEMERFLMNNLLHKLKGNSRWCKYIISYLDFEKECKIMY
ncbi:predicted protein [Naegleria gruberi]|uniref:Predicted protein n=1 Tax=Naegleria gruberi TaxID=5762 RepID=D2V168_NAEGR|nr:uncharacterized protein NAEGRDRAFT_62777 [Naegleria gruberi]EFC49417.1 predicted protein [Naegleria gruberi]|eukprot:XP_002682161.1 predicted protein [Naegleria gruberi strain NEG-M]